MTENLSFLLVFGAGLLTFVSPCVLPLIPSWLCIIGSSPISGNESRPKPVAGTLAFILGFSTVFIVMSIVFSATFNLMSGFFRYINIISGIVVIILGLNVLFDFLSILNYEKRFNLKNKPKGLIGAFLAGCAFSAGWTPCVGPVLTSILLLAANSGSTFRSVFYLILYSAGLGLPFLLASFGYSTFLKVSVKLRLYLPIIQRISGALLILIGVLILGGYYQSFSVMAGSRLRVPGLSGSFTGSSAVGESEIADNSIPENVIRAFREARIPVSSRGVASHDFALPLLDGTEFTLSQQKGRVVFLNFWATWCGPCRDEMPSMEAVYQKLKDREFEIAAVNLRDSINEVSAFVNEYNLTFPVILDVRGMTGSRYNVQAIPSTYIIDKRGLIIARLVGSINWDTPEIIAALETLLAE